MSDETATFKVKGVTNTGEVLLSSIEVQAIMQGMVNDYEKRIAKLEELLSYEIAKNNFLEAKVNYMVRKNER